MLPDNDDGSDVNDHDQVTAILTRARLLLQRGWCRHSEAAAPVFRWHWRTDAIVTEFRPCAPTDLAAERWCIGGAVLRAASDMGLDFEPLLRMLQERLEAAIGYMMRMPHRRFDIPTYNDRFAANHEEVLRAMDRAIGGK